MVTLHSGGGYISVFTLHLGLGHLYSMGSNCTEGAVCGPLEQGLNINNRGTRKLQGGPIQRMMMSWGTFNSQKSTHSPRTIFYLICAKLLADSMTGECYNYRERDGKHRKCCRHWFHQQEKKASQRKHGHWRDVSRRKSCFFPLGAGKKPPPLAFQLVENSHLLFLLPFPSSECPHGAEHWLDQIQLHKRKCREMVQRKKPIVNTDNLLHLSNPS